MEDAITRLRPAVEAGRVGDPVVHWREERQRSIEAAETSDGGDPVLAARRRDFGSLPFVALDVVLAVVAQFPLSIPLVVATIALFVATGHHLVIGGQSNAELDAWLRAPLFTVFGLFVTDGAMLLVLWYRLARQRLPWSAVGLIAPTRERLLRALRSEPGRLGAGPSILVGLGIGAVGLVLSAILGAELQRLGFNQNGQDKLLIEPLKHAAPWVVLSMVFLGTFMAPTVEELFFRGYVFRSVAVRQGVPAAYLVSAGTFALVHLLGGLDLLPLVPVLFMIGLLLCYAYRRTGNLLTDITAHAFNNGAAFALALLIHM